VNAVKRRGGCATGEGEMMSAWGDDEEKHLVKTLEVEVGYLGSFLVYIGAAGHGLYIIV
jgi:hypothetical protein